MPIRISLLKAMLISGWVGIYLKYLFTQLSFTYKQIFLLSIIWYLTIDIYTRIVQVSFKRECWASVFETDDQRYLVCERILRLQIVPDTVDRVQHKLGCIVFLFGKRIAYSKNEPEVHCFNANNPNKLYQQLDYLRRGP